jgi:hypothetical protein
MQTFVDDIQVVTDVPSTLFSIIQQGAVDAGVTLQNLDGGASINYDFQEFNFAGTWADMVPPVSGTLIPGETAAFQVTSVYPQVRLWGSTTAGNANLAFSLSRLYTRPSNGQIPLLYY